MVSIIIPTLNEADALPGTLRAVAGQNRAEILVVDGRSEDGTAEIAEAFGARVIAASERNRAAQMNFGADHASASVLLFLHADTILPEGGLESIQHALRDERVVGGAFARRFDSGSAVLKVTCALAELRNRTIGWYLGDQGIFARTEVFNRLGGFRRWERFEDLDFSRRLRRAGKTVTLKPGVITSARRFAQRGALRTTMRDFFWTMRYLSDGSEWSKPVSRTNP